MSFEILMSIFGAFGIGSVVTLLIKNHLDRNNALEERLYNEKKEAFLETLEALRRLAAEPEQAQQQYLFAIALQKLKLFGSNGVQRAAERITNGQRQPNDNVNLLLDKLLVEMRKDLQSK